LSNVPLGFAPERILTGETTVAARSKEEAARNIRFYGQALPKIAALPGVIAAGAVTAAPGDASHSNGTVQLEGEADPKKYPDALFTVATPGYLQAIGIPLRDGRDFDDRDAADVPFSVIVNDAFVKAAYAPGENPVGKRIRCGYDSPEWMTIVGVAGDIRQLGPAARVAPELIMPYLQHPRPATYMTLTVRTRGEAIAMRESLRATLRQVNPDVPVRFSTIETTLADGTAQPRFRTRLLALLAGLAVLLAMFGVYGVMAYNVSQRLGEIGLRMALGASRGDVIRLVLSNAAKLALTGLIVGVLGALAAGRLLESMLFQMTAYDPWIYAVVIAGSIAAVAAAAFVPARRAAALDPAMVLRQS
jgi:putative ABC transport system permease protein